ncbi:helix-turn-helix transcriptional regulator [Emergencia sp.]|uniref:helix-turn-helix transcriptional regulator n=1 Tax=Emergencia sp. TaxID=1926557 RepID=UPI003AF078EC
MKENFIFRLRQEKGWTQSELARILSVSEKTLAKWEDGIGFPNIKTFELLIRVSGKTVMELLGQEGQDDALLEAIAIYKGEIKTKDRIIVILLGTLIFTMVFLLDAMDLTGFVFLCLPVLISLIGIMLLFIGQQQKRKRNKSLWLFILGGCFLASPLVFYVFLLIIVPFAYGGPVPT